jgi:hypothetical protein
LPGWPTLSTCKQKTQVGTLKQAAVTSFTLKSSTQALWRACRFRNWWQTKETAHTPVITQSRAVELSPWVSIFISQGDSKLSILPTLTVLALQQSHE